MFTKATLHVLATLAIIALLYLGTYMAHAGGDWLGWIIFVVVIGSAGVWFFRSARAPRPR